MLQNHSYIRLANLNDLNIIKNLLYLSKAFWGYDTDFMRKFKQKYSVTADYLRLNPIYLYFIEDALVAFYNFSLQDDTLELDNLFVHPDYIGKGIGAVLWHHCCETAKNVYNKDKFILWSDPNAESFYIKMGCKKIGMKKSPLMPDRSAPILEYRSILHV